MITTFALLLAFHTLPIMSNCPVSTVGHGGSVHVCASRDDPHGEPFVNRGPSYYGLGPASDYSSSGSQTSSWDVGPIGSSYYEKEMGITQDFVDSNRALASPNFRFNPPPYQPSPELVNLQKKLEVKRAVTNELKDIVRKRDHARETVRAMDHADARAEIVEHATDAIKLSRDYYLDNDFENGSIAAKIAEVLVDVSTSTLPVVSWVRDSLEALSGKNMVTGEILNSFDRSVAIFGAVTGGFGSKAIKAFHVFEKLALKNPRPVKKAFELMTDAEKAVKEIFDEGRKILYNKPLSDVKEVVGFFKKHKIYGGVEDVEAIRVVNAFTEVSKARVLTEDLRVYRYYDPNYAKPRGTWVTTENLSMADAEKRLALQFPVTHRQEWIIPKGTEILDGTVAQNFGREGGGYQILLDLNRLQEVAR